MCVLASARFQTAVSPRRTPAQRLLPAVIRVPRASRLRIATKLRGEGREMNV